MTSHRYEKQGKNPLCHSIYCTRHHQNRFFFRHSYKVFFCYSRCLTELSFHQRFKYTIQNKYLQIGLIVQENQLLLLVNIITKPFH